MNVRPSPSGNFYIATYGNLAAFDRDRSFAMRKLAAAIWGVSLPA